MFDILGIDIVDIFEMVGPYITSAGGLGGLLWKQNRDKKNIVKDFQDKHLKARELDAKEFDRKERERQNFESRLEQYHKELSVYAEKEMRSIKNNAWLFCDSMVNHLITVGSTYVDRVVDDDLFQLPIDKIMVKFKEALADSLPMSIDTMMQFIEFEKLSSYDEVSFVESILEKIDDIRDVWISETLKRTGMVDVYRDALTIAVDEKVKKSVERIYMHSLRQSDNKNTDTIITHYRSKFFTPESAGDVIEVNGNPFIGGTD